MKKRKVISGKNKKLALPVQESLIAWLILDRLQSPGWLWGVASTILFFLWVLAIIDIFIREEVELFKG